MVKVTWLARRCTEPWHHKRAILIAERITVDFVRIVFLIDTDNGTHGLPDYPRFTLVFFDVSVLQIDVHIKQLLEM